MSEAAAQTGYTRQRIHQIAQLNPKWHKKIYGRTLVCDPFPLTKPKR